MKTCNLKIPLFSFKRYILSVMLLIAFSYFSIAQDAEGCKDHPLLNRLPDFYIESCTNNYDQMDFFNSNGEVIKVEGNLTLIKYTNTGSTNKAPSSFQIMKNYSNAIIKAGGTKIFSDNVAACYSLRNKSGDYNIKVCCYGTYSENDIVYELSVMKLESMKQEIVANDILEALNKDGHIALDILFNTGESQIKPESQAIVDQIYQMLYNNPSISISIEGHTDNAGTATGNKTLSGARAQAVLDALVSKGIDKSRLSFIGWGQEKPVADNSSEEGKAQNRRVEIVRK